MQNPSHVSTPDITVIGAGVIGLLSAFELAEAGATVRVIDRQQAALESSWAGGGILSPLYPWRYSPPITALASWSQHAYPGVISFLKSATGIDPEWLQNGMLVTAMSERAEALAWGQGLQQAVFEITDEDAHALEPHVRLTETPLWMPKVGSVRNPRLGQALRRLCAVHSRIELIESAEVQLAGSVDQPEVWVSDQHWSSPKTVVAAGAWTTQVLAALGVQCPIKPMKGQMLLFSPCHLVSRVVLADGRYAIPRGDGRIVFGSTLEDVGFVRAPDQAGFEDLYASALRLVPDLAEVPVEAQWAGFRPGSPGGLPWIGPVTEALWINAGHFRNGVVLAPASARLLADQMMGRTPIIDPNAYLPKVN